MKKPTHSNQPEYLSGSPESYTNPAIARAMRSLEEAIPQAQTDPELATYHLRAQAGWMGDINGPIYHKGYYHIF